MININDISLMNIAERICHNENNPLNGQAEDGNKYLSERVLEIYRQLVKEIDK